jgi:ATP-dependent helicase Lhr and Lhr-like helicase
MMPLQAFHPAVRDWFRSTLGTPMPAQTKGWESIRSGRHTLIAAPTGSGKTLAAFLTAIDRLLREGLERGDLPHETRVVYVSPLKALSTDIHQNLSLPLDGIRAAATAAGIAPPTITTDIRTGDTPSARRTAMLKTPPHILVTTPESLYLLVTADRSREMLRTVDTIVLDEIHAVTESRRGSHLALTVQRLEHLTGRPLQRIGLSATQRPIEVVARFLVGTSNVRDGKPDCDIIDEGHAREMDLALEVPASALEAVMAQEVWEEVYGRLAELINEHRTTIVFVNTRRLAERLAKNLSDRLGTDAVTAHHGSLSKEKRLDAEERLRTGQIKALVATASLELGIDIGHVDLVCQLGSTRLIGTLLQRVGRSGHTVRGVPKGRVFPLSRDELVECAAMLWMIRQRELDRLIMIEKPLDVLAQQIVAEAACNDWDESALFDLMRGAYPYRDLTRDEFDEVVQMVAQGFATRRGRRGALVHYDGVNGRIRGRRAARLTAITAGGAIPDNADYRVILEPEQTFVGTVDEDFAVESMPGNVFQLGNASWRILQIVAGTVRVADAKGEPPSIPFWFGEAPSRSVEMSAAVSALRQEIENRVDDPDRAVAWLQDEIGINPAAATQIVSYLADAKHLLGVIPTQQTLLLERFFDESGGMQLVLHAPFGARVNRAWGLALRKKFCRQFNFELQAAAVDNGLLLSLGPQHSFPLDDVFRYLNPTVVRQTLVQALLDAPMFQTRWRWNTTLALAVLRNRAGRKVPPPLQRMQADDLLAAVFPDAAACLENIAGDREVPNHPLVRQSIHDCLHDAMDLDALTAILTEIFEGRLQCVARDTPEPSVLSHEILHAQPYAFLDDAPLEERRSRAVYTRRALEPSTASELGALDADAIRRVTDEAWPEPRDADELHDALLSASCFTETEGRESRGVSWEPLFEELVASRRANRVTVTDAGGSTVLWAPAEQLDHVLSVWQTGNTGMAVVDPPREPHDPPTPTQPERDQALVDIVRGRLEIVGPTTHRAIASSLRLPLGDVEVALMVLEQQGNVLRGSFTPGTGEREWCDRRLLARIHRYTIQRLRSEIEPVSAADYMRFLFTWQKVDAQHHVSGPEGLMGIIEQLDGYEVPAVGWETEVLASRLDHYDPSFLDTLTLTGRVAWGRLSPPTRPGAGPFTTGPVRSTPVALFRREHADIWLRLRPVAGNLPLTAQARQVMDVLADHRATFFHEIVSRSKLLATHVEQALGTLVALGLVTSDSFAGLRALLLPAAKRRPLRTVRRSGPGQAPSGIEMAGRWSLLREPDGDVSSDGGDEVIEAQAWALLRRYGVVFRRVLMRETNLAPWRDLTRVYRRLEARGEIRGGRFVSGMSGEQFALPEAVGSLRAIRREERQGTLCGISAADPLNLTGIITPGERVPALVGNRVVYRDGVPLAAREAGKVRVLTEFDPAERPVVEAALTKRRINPSLRVLLGRAG